MGKFDRLLTILNLMDQGKSCTMEDLMRELKVTERSVYRYIAHLQDAGFLIERDPEAQRYAFARGFSLKKSFMNVEESLAFVLAKRMLGYFGGAFDKAIEGLERKMILTQRPPSYAFTVPDCESQGADIIGSMLMDLAMACREHQKVLLNYVSLYMQETTQREVDPYFLFFTAEGFWNLRAYCHLRNAWRTFALDRIRKWRLLDSYFLPQVLGGDLAEEITRGFGAYFDEDLTEVIVRFDPQIRAYVERKKWHPSQQNRSLDDGWLELRFETTGLKGMVQWLYRWVPHIKIVKPEALRRQMIDDLEEQRNRLDDFGGG